MRKSYIQNNPKLVDMNGTLKKVIPAILLIAAIAGWIIDIGRIVYLAPWSPALGPSHSPERIGLLFFHCYVGCLPTAVFFMYLFSRHPKWNAAPGKYVEGAKVPALRLYTFSAIGIIAALFAAAGFSEVVAIDAQAMVVAATASYFGSIVAFAGPWIGQVIARGILMVPPPAGMPWIGVFAYATLDAMIWAYAGWLFFKLFHGFKLKERLWKGILLFMVLNEPVHLGLWFTVYFITNPWTAFLVSYGRDLVLYWWMSPAYSLIGVLAGWSAYRAMAARAGR